jgi:hypothetical protein
VEPVLPVVPLAAPGWVVPLWSGVLGVAELLPTELLLPEVPVAPVWLVLLALFPLVLDAELWL